MKISSNRFGQLHDGKEATIFTLKNENGLIVKVTNYGAIITSIEMPDKQRKDGKYSLWIRKT